MHGSEAMLQALGSGNRLPSKISTMVIAVIFLTAAAPLLSARELEPSLDIVSPVEPPGSGQSSRSDTGFVPDQSGRMPDSERFLFFKQRPSAPSFGDAAFGLCDHECAGSKLIGALFDRDHGVCLEPVYYGEIFTNARGGISTRNATRYEALLDLPLTVDFQQLRWALPGRFFVRAQNTHGRGLTTEFIGDYQVVSNIDSFRNIMQVSEYWWEMDFFDQRLAVRLGKQDVNTKFLVLDLARDFIHSSFGLSPTAGLPSYPDPSMAAVVMAQLSESLELKVGIWDAFGRGGSWGFSDNETTVTMGELEYSYSLFDGCLPGVVDVGVAYFSGGEISGQVYPWRRSHYLQIEQLVLREEAGAEGEPQGLGAFARYSARYGTRDLPITSVWEEFLVGIVYRGPIPRRDEDIVGAGIAWAKLSQNGALQETVVDVFYKAALRPWLSVQPDIQYIANPSGVHRDALAIGIRFEIAL